MWWASYDCNAIQVNRKVVVIFYLYRSELHLYFYILLIFYQLVQRRVTVKGSPHILACGTVMSIIGALQFRDFPFRWELKVRDRCRQRGVSSQQILSHYTLKKNEDVQGPSIAIYKSYNGAIMRSESQGPHSSYHPKLWFLHCFSWQTHSALSTVKTSFQLFWLSRAIR